MNAPSNDERFLHLNLLSDSAVGLGHIVVFFHQFIGLASSLRRTAIISDLALAAHHNNGIRPDCDPRIYRNLDTARCYGDDLPAEGARPRYEMLADIDLASFKPEETLRIRADRRGRLSATPDHARAKLLILDYPRVTHGVDGSAMLDHRQHITATTPSEPVVSIANAVIADMIKRSEGHPRTLRFYQHRHRGQQDGLPADYCALHVRRTDALAERPYSRFTTNLRRIMRHLETIPTLEKRSIIYLMTDEKDPRYFRKLKQAYSNLWTYRDFPQLRALLEGDAYNNHLLFAVERAMYSSAAIKVSTDRKTVAGHRHIIVPHHWTIKIPPFYAGVRRTLRRKAKTALVRAGLKPRRATP